MKHDEENCHKEPSASIPAGILYCLSGLLLIQCMVQIWIIHNYSSPMNSYLFRREVSDPVLIAVDQIQLWTILIGCIGIFYRRLAGLLIPMSLVFLMLAVFKMLNSEGGPIYDRFAPAAQAIRIFFPLALFLLVSSKPGRHAVAWWGIRICTALTFITHGAECFFAHPGFIDLIIGSAYRILEWEISESQARGLMVGIGVMDIGMALLLVGRRWRAIALWMAFWGGLAACSRVMSGGWEYNWYKTLLRVANSGGPLVLFLWWHYLKRRDREGSAGFTGPAGPSGPPAEG